MSLCEASEVKIEARFEVFMKFHAKYSFASSRHDCVGHPNPHVLYYKIRLLIQGVSKEFFERKRINGYRKTLRKQKFHMKHPVQGTTKYMSRH